jgi:hypothetical protein
MRHLNLRKTNMPHSSEKNMAKLKVSFHCSIRFKVGNKKKKSFGRIVGCSIGMII